MANRQVWWYAKAGEKYGPMTGRELKALAAVGGLSPKDKVWKVGLPRWVDASVVRGLLPPEASPLVSAQPQTDDPPQSLEPTEAGRAPPPSPKGRANSGRARPAARRPTSSSVSETATAAPELQHIPPEPVMESKAGVPWSPSRVLVGVTSRASTISLGVPEDLLRAFVGPAYDRFYRSHWHTPPETTPKSRRLLANLNWSAAAFTVFWLAYRKIYQQLLIVLLLMLPPVFLLGWVGIPGGSLMLYALASLTFLFRGNHWYFSHARQRIRQITDLGLPADVTREKLARAGGTSLLPGLTTFLGVVLVMALAGMLLGLWPALMMQF